MNTKCFLAMSTNKVLVPLGTALNALFTLL